MIFCTPAASFTKARSLHVQKQHSQPPRWDCEGKVPPPTSQKCSKTVIRGYNTSKKIQNHAFHSIETLWQALWQDALWWLPWHPAVAPCGSRRRRWLPKHAKDPPSPYRWLCPRACSLAWRFARHVDGQTTRTMDQKNSYNPCNCIILIIFDCLKLWPVWAYLTVNCLRYFQNIILFCEICIIVLEDVQLFSKT